MPVVHECADPDYDVLTMGEFCLEHERPKLEVVPTLLAAVELRAASDETPAPAA